MAKQHWTQTEEGRAKMREIQARRWKNKTSPGERAVASAARKRAHPKETVEGLAPTLVYDGWRVTITRDEIKLTREK